MSIIWNNSKYNSKYNACICVCKFSLSNGVYNMMWLLHFRKEHFNEDIPDIEDIWTSSFIDQIPQLDGTGDEDPPSSKCIDLGYS